MKNVITYTVNKNFNNELYLSVQNGEVVVKAPWYYTLGQIQNIIEVNKYIRELICYRINTISRSS